MRKRKDLRTDRDLRRYVVEFSKYAQQKGDANLAATMKQNAQQFLITFCGAPAMHLDFAPTRVTRKP
jgi:hypothetical protein